MYKAKEMRNERKSGFNVAATLPIRKTMKVCEINK
jgi:hypothetical protein